MNSDKGLKRGCALPCSQGASTKAQPDTAPAPVSLFFASFPLPKEQGDPFPRGRSLLTWFSNTQGPTATGRGAQRVKPGRQLIGGLTNSSALTFHGKTPNSHQPLSNPHPANPHCDLGALCTQTNTCPRLMHHSSSSAHGRT